MKELANKESAMISKALRNEGLRIIPTDIVEDSLVVARKTLADKAAKDPDAAKKLVIDSFSSIGILPKQLEEYLRHSLDTISPKELEDLRGIYQAIRDTEANWADFKNEKEDQESEPGRSPPPEQKQDQDPGPESEASSEQETKPEPDPEPEPPQETQPEETEQKLYGQLRDKAMQEKNWQEDLDAAEKGESLLYKFIEHVAQDKNVAVNYVLQEALSSFEGFWQHFEPWRIKEIESQPDKTETSNKGRPPSPDTIIKKLTEKKAPENIIAIARQAFKEATPEELRDIYQAVSKEIPDFVPLEKLVTRLELWPDKDKEQDKADPPKKDGLFL